MTRKMNMSETSVQKMRADNYALKMALDEIKSKKGGDLLKSIPCVSV